MIALFRALLLLSPVALAQQPASPFLPVPPAASDELRFIAPLPEFEAKDTAGRVWHLDDLRGRFTLIYIWHTFAARASDGVRSRERQSVFGLPDLPEVQRFYGKVKDSRKLQVLTFCQDYDYTHAPEYMRQKGYTFPVIADWVLLNHLLSPIQGQAPYAIVNPEGKLSAPFRSWTLGRLLFELESAEL